jgi:hypothetical protein
MSAALVQRDIRNSPGRYTTAQRNMSPYKGNGTGSPTQKKGKRTSVP